MPETKNYTLPEAAAKVAQALREKLTNVESEIRALRARELQPKEGSLAKHELCPLCGGPDRNGVCNCIQKNAAMGYGPGTPGAGAPSSTGLGDSMGPGTQPMAMGEDKSALLFGKEPKKKDVLPKGPSPAANAKVGGGGRCSECGEMGHLPSQHTKKAMNGEGDGGAVGLQKDAAGLSDVGALSKKTPDGISEKTMHKLKDEYGHDKEGKAKAYATANAIANGTVHHKSEAPLKKHSVVTPVPQVNQEMGGFKSLKGPTSVAHANQEMGGFKSLISNPTAPTAKVGAMVGAVPGRMKIASMGRPRAAVAGTIGKAEKEMKPVVAAPVKASPKTKMPEAGKEVSAEGSGGELRKDAMPAATKKVAGLQPPGQGGGDAHKVLGPGPSAIPKPGVTAKKIPQMNHPHAVDVDVSDFDRGPAVSPLKAAGAAEAGRLGTAAGRAPALQAAGNAEVARMRGANDAANLAADKRAGGVGFLNSLISRFSRTPKVDPNVNPDGTINRTPVRSQRFHGALPLQRAEVPMKKSALAALGKCAMCKAEEHGGMCKGLSLNHSRTMLSVAPAKKARARR